MPNRIQLRRGSALEWSTANPLLAEGEICVELDTEKFKIGTGNTLWNDLAYSSGPIGPAGTITVGTVAISSTTTIINVGTPENAVLNFTIEPGPKGDTGTQINKLIDIPDIDSTGLATGSLLVYDGTAMNWNTEKDLPITSNIDAGEF